MSYHQFIMIFLEGSSFEFGVEVKLNEVPLESSSLKVQK